MFIAKWYTRASRIRIVIAKFDGKWKLPGGPYPIPELVAAVGGVLATLFLLPRVDHPLIMAGIGLTVTSVVVAWMRKMPYSPVPFGTRVHRICRLYTEPISLSSPIDRSPNTVSVVRHQVDVLDHLADDAQTHPRYPREGDTPSTNAAWSSMFDQPGSAASDLFD